tara:strand:+ start:99 stop:329 length:231 start_codon:yes stop_codon:yes gene_type:complete
MNRVHRYLGQEPQALETLAKGLTVAADAGAGGLVNAAQQAACAPLVEEVQKKAKMHCIAALGIGAVVGFFAAKHLG